jgi:hypothetical protein
MTLPTNTPSAILDILERYRQGTIDQGEARLRVAKLAKGDAEMAKFVKSHLKWLDYDDSVEWG